jgi:PTH2 family peptidyl-tRNA hydrolase
MIVMRTDLNMRKGKMVAQGAHASLAAVLHGTKWGYLGVFFDRRLRTWLRGRFTKVCVGVKSEQGLLDVAQQAHDAGMICYVITDAGKTEFGGVPTKTCCAIGPETHDNLLPITGKLDLL